jgi:adhesin/invasin
MLSSSFLLALIGCGGSDLVLPNDAGPSSVTATAGNAQNGSVGQPLSDSLVATVTDRQGAPVSGVRVAFIPADAASGTVSPDTTTTDSKGHAAAQWVLGAKPGAQNVTATIPDMQSSPTATFTATASPGTATSIAMSSGDNQTAPAGTTLPAPLVVMVTDQFGNPVPGIDVTWDPQMSGSVDPTTSTTGTDGLASTQRTLGSGAGTQIVTASAAGLNGSPVTFTQTSTSGPASSLQLVSGNGQTGLPGQELPDPLVVRLLDASGNPIAGNPVSWILGQGGGTVVPNGNTDADGKASATFTLGPTAGATNTVNAVVSGVGIIQFTAKATGGSGGGGGGGGGGSGPSAANSTVSAAPTSIVAGTGSSTITVTVRDGSGAPVAGATVHLSATGSGNSLTQPGGATGADGVATGTLSSSVPGSKVVSAKVNNSVDITQTAEVVVTIAPATTLTIVAGNGQNAEAGKAVPVDPSVKVTNDAGQGIAGFGVTFVVTGGNGSVTGASQTTNSNGIATVGSWVLGDVGTNTLEARATGLNGSPAVFTATASPAPTHLVFQVQPTSPQVQDRDFTPAVEVAAVDAGGTVVPISGLRIQLSITPSRGQLKGTTSENTSNGVAVFSDIRAGRDGTGYVLNASAPDRPELGTVTSTSFDVNKH